MFVLALGVVVAGVADGGLGSWLAGVLVPGSTLPELLEIAGIAAVCASLLNNLPAVLLLVPLLSGYGEAPLLAMLIGVNVGAGATYIGSLANLLWNRGLARVGQQPPAAEFHRVGLLISPPVIIVAVVVLWAWLRLLG